MRRSVALGILVALAAILVLTGLYLSMSEPPPVEPVAEPVPIGGPFELVDHEGREVTDQAFRGKLMFVYFGYTFCPDICPTSLQVMSTALAELGEAADEVAFLFITVDPERDTVEVVKDYVELFEPAPIGLTGTREQVDAAAAAYRVYHAIPEQDRGDAYLVDHSSFAFLMDRDGLYAAHFSHDATPEEMAAKIREVLG